MSTNEEMSLVEHLGELRKRIMWILLVLVIGMVAGLISARPIIRFLKNIPPADSISWNVFSPWDALRLYMNFGLAVGILIALPVTLYHIWAFVKPGLRETEQKASIIYIPYAFLLFLAGLSFGYWVVFPMAFYFTSSISKSLDITEMYGAAQYFTFMFNILLPLAIVFEMPIVVMFLTKIRLLNPKRLHKFRRYAYMLLVILATVITPPDAISAILVALPLIVLYEFSVFMSRFIYRKQLLQDAEWEREFGPK
ncbi:twin-arginine translocase subunit TatC [Paenibacillus chondroitinus]|uniref:Sec-independent protein translocase protein TatC n=1 Tax=Paenibacillus chondroitinus TaxID=59842 RepID=A0ABU6DBR0_9BACL|nr:MULTISPECIES: twin-arginine translocase subunit TatC [Paenibacillus]MCY9657485.1 twin-arginine translocase subunit TatC [Paenibacillus anseongense]MEB4794896.1 twin-arginine translocase subunit TatC [Paenibacillus chondroitinus]